MLFGKKKQNKSKDLKEAEKRIQELQEQVDGLQEELREFQKAMDLAVARVGMVRYNAFAEVGGDQSFSVALLDSLQNGLVLTSHYGRDANRIYAKPVREGKSEYALSHEEEEAIRKALGNAQGYGTANNDNKNKGRGGKNSR